MYLCMVSEGANPLCHLSASAFDALHLTDRWPIYVRSHVSWMLGLPMTIAGDMGASMLANPRSLDAMGHLNNLADNAAGLFQPVPALGNFHTAQDATGLQPVQGTSVLKPLDSMGTVHTTQ